MIPTTMEETARAVVCDIADQLEHSWNVADGSAYAEPFADDADLITTTGDHIRGREAITAGVSGALRGLCAESPMTCRVVSTRCRGPTTIVALIESVRRDVAVLATAVITETGRGWEVAALHNTVGPNVRRHPTTRT